jgi:hypothetical protein
MEEHIASMSTPDISLLTLASYLELYFYLTGCEIKPTHIDMWLYVISH